MKQISGFISRSGGISGMVGIESIVLQVIGEAPEWLRRDLTSTDASARRRAEETLATRIELHQRKREAVRRDPEPGAQVRERF